MFYVYAHRRNDNGSRFYIGKGSANRAWSHKGRNLLWRRIVKKHGYSVEVVSTGLTEEEAFQKEKELIAFHGRIALNNGALVNMTDGGEGVSGIIYTKDQLTQRSAYMKKAWENPEMRALWVGKLQSGKYFKGKVHSEASKRIISVASKEFWMDDGKKRNASLAMKEKWQNDSAFREKITQFQKAYQNQPDVRAKNSARNSKYQVEQNGKKVVCVESGMIFDSMSCAAKWLQKNGVPGATASHVCKVCKGKLKSAYGYGWAYCEIKK